MSKIHYARISGLFVAACICVAVSVAQSFPITAGSEEPQKKTVAAGEIFFDSLKRAPFSILAQTETLTETGTTTLPPVETISPTQTLLDVVILETEANEENQVPVDSAPDDPAPVNSVPADPASVDSAPVDSAPDDPAPDDPAPVGSVPDDPVPVDSVPVDITSNEVIDGTVFANRTSASVAIFIEGELYRLAPLRSLGITLRRSPALINMFSCDADTPENESTCYWDGYKVSIDGFYEIFNKSPEGAPLQLVLEEAGPPPTDRIWIQNRSGQREILIVENELYELQPATVQEFKAQENSEVDFYHRSCIQLADESVCEWIPKTIKTGFYYALSETTAVGRLAGSVLSQAEIQPILAQGGGIIEKPLQLVCQVQVPKLNVRSGPGLNYLIVTAIASNNSSSNDRISAIGRDVSGEWVAVDQSIALGGWVNSSKQLIVCDGDIATLPIAETTDGRLAPTAVPTLVRAPVPPTAVSIPTRAPAIPAPLPTPVPRPAVIQAAPPTPAPPPTAVPVPTIPPVQAETAVEEAGDSAEAVEIPAGQVKLLVQNVFEHEVRFTLSPDEYDLQPNQTITIIRPAGRFTFSVSSPWRNLSGNAELTLEEGQTFSMFLYFTPKPGRSDEWEMKFQ